MDIKSRYQQQALVFAIFNVLFGENICMCPFVLQALADSGGSKQENDRRDTLLSVLIKKTVVMDLFKSYQTNKHIYKHNQASNLHLMVETQLQLFICSSLALSATRHRSSNKLTSTGVVNSLAGDGIKHSTDI